MTMHAGEDGHRGAPALRRLRRLVCSMCLVGLVTVAACIWHVIEPEARMVIGMLVRDPVRTIHSCSGAKSRSVCFERQPLLDGWEAQTVVRLTRERQTWRYFSAFACGVGAVCLAFKNHKDEAWCGTLHASDGYSFDGDPALVLPSPWRVHGLGKFVDTHTLGVLALGPGQYTRDSEYLLIGGSFRFRSVAGRHQTGIWLARGRAPTFTDPPTRAGGKSPVLSRSQWRDVRFLFNGTHPGCIERRLPRVLHGACEFDGRLSLTGRFRGRHFLYARQNPSEVGNRFVQVVVSADTYNWSAFAPIRIEGYRAADGDIYFFAAQINPVDPHSLIALAPFVHRGCGCVGIVASRDGISWSRIFPLLRAETDLSGVRATSHPVAGLVRRKDAVILYVHHHVWLSGAMVDAKGLFKEREPFPNRRVVAYTIPLGTFMNWTATMLATLNTPTHDFTRGGRAV